METSASCEARYAPLLYPTNQVLLFGLGVCEELGVGGAGASKTRAGSHFESLRYSQRNPAPKIVIAGNQKNGDSRCQRGISMPSPMTETATRTTVGISTATNSRAKTPAMMLLR